MGCNGQDKEVGLYLKCSGCHGRSLNHRSDLGLSLLPGCKMMVADDIHVTAHTD